MTEAIKCKITNSMILNLFFMTSLVIRNSTIVPVTKTTAPRYKLSNKKSIAKTCLDFRTLMERIKCPSQSVCVLSEAKVLAPIPG